MTGNWIPLNITKSNLRTTPTDIICSKKFFFNNKKFKKLLKQKQKKQIFVSIFGFGVGSNMFTLDSLRD